jgi:hypothetical protein
MNRRVVDCVATCGDVDAAREPFNTVDPLR